MFLPAAAGSITSVDSIRQTAPYFKAIELSVDFALDKVDSTLIDTLKAIKAEHDLTYTIHAPFRDINIASLNDAIYQAALSETLRAMQVAIDLEARLLNLHPGVHGYFPPRYRAEMKQREREVIRRLCALGEQHHILIAVENLINTNVHFEDTWTLDGLVELLEQVDSPALGLCLDTGHAFQAGLNVPEAVRRMAGIKAGMGRNGSSLIHVHAQDNHGGPIDEHLPVGDGLIPWAEVLTALQETHYEGMIVFENMGLERQLTALEHWTALQPQP